MLGAGFRPRVVAGMLAPGARAQVAEAITPVVKTTNGPIVGWVYDGIKTFQGVRYGAPPVGPLRFAPPRKPDPWTQPADASHTGAASMRGCAAAAPPWAFPAASAWPLSRPSPPPTTSSGRARTASF